MSKLNCWEFKKCGREPGGANVEELGICTAAENQEFDGLNSGKQAGRICWALAGTLCGGSVQGEFASKMDSCIMCDFYHTVSSEEDDFEVYPASMARTNCWEFKECGREPGGNKTADLGICPAAENTSVNGVNMGQNGGRSCWAIAGTLCGGSVQGVFAEKMANCATCDFYNKVLNEETDFVMLPDK